ncbi:MAG: hypothetical protein KAI83_03405 [Thiomargarita sp.]|nr:hypothetical protein [Thiomargarita sp.]
MNSNFKTFGVQRFSFEMILRRKFFEEKLSPQMEYNASALTVFWSTTLQLWIKTRTPNK